MRDRIVPFIASLYVFLYLYTGLSKALDVPKFVSSMKHSPALYPYAETLGILIPAVEIFIAILIIVPFTRYMGLISATSLMALFTGYVAYILFSGSTLPCTCGGIIEQLGWRDHLIVNSSFLVLGIIAVLLSKHKDFIEINRSSRTPV